MLLNKKVFPKWISIVTLISLLTTSCQSTSENPALNIVMANTLSDVTAPHNDHNTKVHFINEPDRPSNSNRLKHISLAAVGDIMVHRTQLIKADQGDYFDFSDSLKYIKPYIQEADYAFGNLETTLAGELGQRRINTDQFYKGYSGYPCFNSPDILATNLYEAGFDFFSTANNHSFDSKIEGIDRTIEVLDRVGILHTGTYMNEAEAEKSTVIEVDGISFGVINYTYGLNGFSLPLDEDYKINHLDMYDEERINTMNQKVKALEPLVDFVIVMLHYGNEYVQYPDAYYQQPIVDGLFESGADIIFAGHPHVIQPIDIREIVRDNNEIETGVVIYSLGNFMSSQRSTYNNGSPTDIGMIFNVDIKQVDDLKPTIESIGFLTTMTLWSDNQIMVVPTQNIPAQLTLNSYDQSVVNRANTEITDLLTSMMKVEFEYDSGYYRYKLP